MAEKKLNIKVRTDGAKRAKKDLKGVEGGIKSIGKSALKIGAAFFAARGLITGFSKMIELSGQFQKVEKGFKSLAASSGFSTKALQKFQTATDGTVSSLDLMRQANNAMLLGIADSEDQMANMFDVAQRLAGALGKDTAFGIESLVTGLGRQSKLMLDNLGIMVDVNAAYEVFAEDLGIASSQLTDQQRKQAFVNATMRSANILVGKLGEETLSMSDNILAMKAAVSDAAAMLGETFAPAVIKVSGYITTLTGYFSAFIKKVNELTGRDGGGEEPPLKIAAKQTQEIAEGIKLSAEAAATLADFSSQTASSIATSAIMGDSMSEALKRALFQQILITAQMKLQEAIKAKLLALESVAGAAGGPGGWLIGAANFLFGASPTQTAPSAGAASSSKITINQNFGGMGVIDHNFAANSIIPAINKAINTGQARIG
tara:strand:- start:287 stop:1579 length:1293 start_codon:yes stop_codon:yes gene_type:complete